MKRNMPLALQRGAVFWEAERKRKRPSTVCANAGHCWGGHISCDFRIMAEQGGEPPAWMSGNISEGKNIIQNGSSDTKDGLLFMKKYIVV
ncbi:hypothetical protein [Saccharococcus thermophilus]|uniref:hypothetical protein n=1 Tax=Saccharococcus thermophilus TaxID=29396 RepID=UPI0036D392A1